MVNASRVGERVAGAARRVPWRGTSDARSRGWAAALGALAVVAALATATAPLAAQSAVSISGTVRNDAGAPINAATVAITALGVGTQTNAQGRYSLTVPAARANGQAATIEARLVGFRRGTAEIMLTPGASITRDFVLETAPTRLTEVVVTGSGTTTTREKLGTSVSTVQNEAITKATEPNLVNALAAKATGVEVTSSAGDPGAGSGILIRGFKTIEGNGQPLFVVDGVPIDNSTIVTSEFSDNGVSYSNRALDLNPNDIESIEILKGAAASSIYGLRAANGVVLVTTKSGRAGQTRVTLSSTTTFDEVNRVIPLQNRFARGTNGVTSVCVENTACQLRSWGAEVPAGTPVYDHANEIFETGNQFDNNLQVSGGDANRAFFISGGWFDQDGIAKGPNSSLTRYSARLKASQALGSKLRIGGNVMYTDLRQQALQKGNNLNGLMLGATRQPPDYNSEPYKTEQGWQRAWSNPIPTDPPTIDNLIFDGPFWVANEQNNTSDVGRAIGGVTVDWNPLSWLQVNYSLGADYGSEARVLGLPPYSAGDAFTGQIYQANISNLIVDHNLLATAKHEFSQNFIGRLAFGQNLNSTRFRQLQVKGTGMITPDLFTLNNVVSTNMQPQNFETKTNIAGYFGQAETDLWDQLYLSVGVRADQSSTLSSDNRTAWFPKGSIAWNVTNFLGNRDQRGILSYLKVRAAYGEVGRQPQPYQILTNYSPEATAFAFGGGSTNPSQAGNGGLVTDIDRGDLNLKFERTKETEAGFDFGFWNQRIDGSVAYYDARSTDVIFAVTVPPSTGFQNAIRNGGEVTNKGWEVALNARVLDIPNYQWDIGVNWTRNRNKLEKLEGAEFVDVTGGFGVSRAVAGQPLGSFYADDFVRCRYGDDANFFDTSLGTETDINAVCQQEGAAEGALFIDEDGFPIYDGRNMVLGNPNPNYLLGLRTGFTLFKKLRLSALVDIKNGGQVWNGTRMALQSYGTAKVTENRGNTYTFGQDVPGFPKGAVAGPGANLPVEVGFSWWRNGLGNNFNGPTSQGIEDGGFTRLREISVAYTFDQPWVRQKMALTSIDVRVSGRNLGLWTDYSGIDPETNLTGPIGVGRGVDYFNSPNTRSWVIALQLTR